MRTLRRYLASTGLVIHSKLLLLATVPAAASSAPTFWPQGGLGTRAQPSDDLWVVSLLLAKEGAAGSWCWWRRLSMEQLSVTGAHPLDTVWLSAQTCLWRPQTGTSQERSCHFSSCSPSVQGTTQVLVLPSFRSLVRSEWRLMEPSLV